MPLTPFGRTLVRTVCYGFACGRLWGGCAMTRVTAALMRAVLLRAGRRGGLSQDARDVLFALLGYALALSATPSARPLFRFRLRLAAAAS